MSVAVVSLLDFRNVEIPLVGDDYKGEILSVYSS